MGSHKVKLTKRVYIERSDFREVDSQDYFRLSPGKMVGFLNMPYPIKIVSFTKDEATNLVQEIKAIFHKGGGKPKTYIHRVPDDSPTAEVRIHTALFESDQPTEVPGGFMSDIRSDSETTWPDAMVEAGFYEVKQRAPWPEAEGKKKGESGPESIRFQAMRVGYFVGDYISIYVFPIVRTRTDPCRFR